MAYSYFIYYRISRPAEAEAAVRRLQSALFENHGIRGRLLKKRDDPLLWMEIYEGVHDTGAFETSLAGLVEALNLPDLLIDGSQRKLECFADPCA